MNKKEKPPLSMNQKDEPIALQLQCEKIHSGPAQ